MKRTLNKKMKRLSAKGFSLIELMVVLVIAGIILSFVTLKFGDFGGQRRLNLVGEQLKQLLALARSQAIIRSEVMGLAIDTKGYTFFRFNGRLKRFEDLSQDTVYRARKFPAMSKASLSIEGSNAVPNVIFQASGLVTPFSLDLVQLKHKLQLTQSNNGELTLQLSAAP